MRIVLHIKVVDGFWNGNVAGYWFFLILFLVIRLYVPRSLPLPINLVFVNLCWENIKWL